MQELHQRLSAAETPQEKTALERQIAATDTQIDRLVYDLYGLTEEEIKSWREQYESPGGTTDNSPPFQRRVQVIKTNRVPKGRKKICIRSGHFCRLRGFLLLYSRPRLKPWAYFLSSRWDLICAARTRPEVLAHGHHSVERQFTASVTFRSVTIDRLVYDLYGLTEVEIAIVEGSLRGCIV